MDWTTYWTTLTTYLKAIIIPSPYLIIHGHGFESRLEQLFLHTVCQFYNNTNVMTAIAVTSESTTRPVTSTQEANGLATTLNPSNTAGTVGGAVGGVIVMLLVIIIVTVIIVVLLKRNGQSRKVNGTEEQAASRYVDGYYILS